MNNRVCNLLDIDYPIIQGGMGNISDPRLAAAISNAGGLGTIGVGTLPVNEAISRMKKMKELTVRSCCVNLPISVHPDAQAIAEAVVEAGIPVVSLSAGNPKPLLPFFKANGVRVMCVTASVRQAQKAEEAGADLVVCEGYEAAGINSPLETTTMTLVPQIADAVTIPVIAAGGIADGRGLAAALSLGAEGVQMGTRFIATQEASFHDSYKQKIIEADDQATMIIGRTYNRIRRLLKTDYARSISEQEQTGLTLEEFMDKTNEDHHVAGAVLGDLGKGFLNSGQIAGVINHIPRVHDLLKEMTECAQKILQEKQKLL